MTKLLDSQNVCLFGLRDKNKPLASHVDSLAIAIVMVEPEFKEYTMDDFLDFFDDVESDIRKMTKFVCNDPDDVECFECWGMQLTPEFSCPEPETRITVFLAANIGLCPVEVINCGDVIFGLLGDQVVLAGEILGMCTQASLQPRLGSVVLTAVEVRIMPVDLSVMAETYCNRGMRAELLDEVIKAGGLNAGVRNVAWSLGHSDVCWDILETLDETYRKALTE